MPSASELVGAANRVLLESTIHDNPSTSDGLPGTVARVARQTRDELHPRHDRGRLGGRRLGGRQRRQRPATPARARPIRRPQPANPTPQIAAVRDRLQQRHEGRLRRLGARLTAGELPLRVQPGSGAVPLRRRRVERASWRPPAKARSPASPHPAQGRGSRSRRACCWSRPTCRRRARSIQPAVTIDGPSQDIVGFGGVAMAEDGTGGLVYLKRVEGVAARVRLALRRRPVAVADPGRHGRALRGQLAAHRRRRRGRARRRVGHPGRHRRSGRTVHELLGADARPGCLQLPARRRSSTPTSRYGRGTSPGPRDELHRARPTSSTGSCSEALPAAAPARSPCCARATSSSRSGSRTSKAKRWARLGVHQPRPRRLDARPDRSQRPADRARARPATAWSSGRSPTSTASRGSGRGGSSDARLDYVLPVSATTYDRACRSATTPMRRASPSHGTGQAEVAYRQTAAPGRRCPGPGSSSTRSPTASPPKARSSPERVVADEAVSGGAAASVGPPSVDIDAHDDTRLLYDARRHGTRDRNRDDEVRPARGRRSGAVRRRPRTGGRQRHEPSRRRRLGLAERGTGRAPAWRCARISPTGACRPRSSRRRRRPDLGPRRSGPPALGDGLVGFMQGPIGNAAIVASALTRAARAVPRSRSPTSGCVPRRPWSRGRRRPTNAGPLSYARRRGTGSSCRSPRARRNWARPAGAVVRRPHESRCSPPTPTARRRSRLSRTLRHRRTTSVGHVRRAGAAPSP